MSGFETVAKQRLCDDDGVTRNDSRSGWPYECPGRRQVSPTSVIECSNPIHGESVPDAQ